MQTPTNIIPKKILDMLQNGDVMELTERIAESHGLEPQYYGALYRATRNVLLGKLPPSGFIPMLESDIGGAHEDLVSITQDINRDIFYPNKDALKQLHGGSPAAAAPVPTPYPGVGGAALSSLPSARIDMPEPEKRVLPEITPVSLSLPRPATVVPPPTSPQPNNMSVAAQPIPPPSSAVAPSQAPQTPTVPALVSPQMEVTTLKPQQTAPTPATTPQNNLEAKLGGTFTIKKEVMYTQPGTPTPMTPTAPVPQAPKIPPPMAPKPAMPTPPPPTATLAVPTTPLITDPYRELP